MAKFLDSEGLVELAEAINDTFLRKNTYATSTAPGIIKIGTGLKQTSTNHLELNIGSQFTFNATGGLMLKPEAIVAGNTAPIACGLFLGTDAAGALNVKTGAGLKSDDNGALTLSLGSGFALTPYGTLVFSSNPADLQVLANMLKPYI